MDVNIYSTKDYENQGRLRPAGKQTQTNPILERMNANFCAANSSYFCYHRRHKDKNTK